MKTKMIIPVPEISIRASWTTLAETGLSEDVVLEIVGRYFDAQDHAIAYRKRAASKAKLLKEFAEAHGFGTDNSDTPSESE